MLVELVIGMHKIVNCYLGPHDLLSDENTQTTINYHLRDVLNWSIQKILNHT